MMTRFQNKKFVRLAASAAGLLALAPSYAFAAESAVGKIFGWAFSSVAAIAGIPGTLIGFIAYVVNYIMGFIAATLFSIGGWVLEWALQLNASIMDNPIIAVGWGITRDMANLGFVLAIIVIAFATILRIESYGMKKALWKLIVAALLVNFSLVIAGVILDFSGVLTNTFLAGSSPSAGLQLHEFAKNLSTAFGVNKVLEAVGTQLAAEDYRGAFSTFGGSTLSSIASIFFVAIFTFFGAITFLVIAIMVLLRYIIISLLLVVAPLAWLFWIFDDLKNLWNKWWDEFFRWTFFLPSALFFLHLAIFLAVNRSDYVNQQLQSLDPSNPDYANAALQIASAPAQIGQMLLILGLMYAGLIMSYSISGQFSKVAGVTGGWAAGRLQDYGKRRGIQIATAPLRLQALRNKADAWQKGIQKGEYGYAGRMVRSAIARPVQWVQQQGGDLAEEYKKGLKGKSPAQIALRYGYASGAEKAAIIDQLASSGDLDTLPSVDMDLYQRFGLDPKNVTKRNPLLNKEVLEAVQNRDVAGFETQMTKVLGSMESSKWGEVQWNDVLNKGINTGVSEVEWNATFRPRIINTVVREGSPTMKNEFSQLMRKLKPAQQRTLKEDVSRLEQAGTRINAQVADYLKNNLGQDLISGVVSGGTAAGGTAPAGAGEGRPPLFDASGRPIT